MYEAGAVIISIVSQSRSSALESSKEQRLHSSDDYDLSMNLTDPYRLRSNYLAVGAKATKEIGCKHVGDLSFTAHLEVQSPTHVTKIVTLKGSHTIKIIELWSVWDFRKIIRYIDKLPGDIRKLWLLTARARSTTANPAQNLAISLIKYSTHVYAKEGGDFSPNPSCTRKFLLAHAVATGKKIISLLAAWVEQATSRYHI